jgi:AmmeMemoRadiSam system protein B
MGFSMPSSLRRAAVAGLFYPAEKQTLERTLNDLLAGAPAAVPQPRRTPKAIIAPHAGYVYSGPIAASAYRLLASVRDTIKRVVLLGPTHRVAVRGVALPSAGRFATPLGTVDVDTEAVAQLERLPQVVVSDNAHALEHSLEVHLPFLQTVLSDFKLVPLAVGYAQAQDVAAVLDTLWGGPETLIVVSSDLSHYLGYREANAVDAATCKAILDLRDDIDHERACGATPVCGLAMSARRRNLRPELLDLRNSGDTAGDRDRVVGYAAFAFYEE